MSGKVFGDQSSLWEEAVHRKRVDAGKEKALTYLRLSSRKQVTEVNVRGKQEH